MRRLPPFGRQRHSAALALLLLLSHTLTLPLEALRARSSTDTVLGATLFAENRHATSILSTSLADAHASDSLHAQSRLHEMSNRAYVGLTNALGVAEGVDADAGRAAAASELNLTAFTALGDPALTAPFREEMRTMWSAMQFLCQTFDGRSQEGASHVEAGAQGMQEDSKPRRQQHGRGILGCDSILQLPPPGENATAPGSVASANDDETGTLRPAGAFDDFDMDEESGNEDDGDDDDVWDKNGTHAAEEETAGKSEIWPGSQAEQAGSSPLHAASLFRFLRAEPLGFSHMKVRVGNDVHEPLADASSAGSYFLRQELERKIFRKIGEIERLQVRRKQLQLHQEYCDKIIMTLTIYRAHISPWLRQNTTTTSAHSSESPSAQPTTTVPAQLAQLTSNVDPFEPTDGLAKSLDEEFAQMVATMGKEGAEKQASLLRQGARKTATSAASPTDFDHSDIQAVKDLRHWRLLKGKDDASILAVDKLIKTAQDRLKELHRLLARLGPDSRKKPRLPSPPPPAPISLEKLLKDNPPPNVLCRDPKCLRVFYIYECIAYRRAAAASMWMMGLSASFKARSILLTFFPTMEKFWLQLTAAIYQTKATKWKKKKKEINKKKLDGRLDFLCLTSVISAKEFCNQENYDAYEKSKLANASWKIPRSACSRAAQRVKKMKKLKNHKECYAMVEAQFEKASQIVMGTIQGLKQLIEDFFKSIFAWIFLLIDADKYKRQARDLWIMTELVDRPPPSENTTMHLIMEQKRIATRYGDSVARIQLAMADDDYKAAESLTSNATFLKNYSEAVRLARRNAENAAKSAEDTEFEAAQFKAKDDPSSDDIPLTISPIDVFK
eukprot:INCI17287.2.p1 GENE.INCI17287.2~~INCI17287.2.p1  ORF type:complete len:842 (-),score=156.71 INCI17287.2:2617-5142(-)